MVAGAAVYMATVHRCGFSTLENMGGGEGLGGWCLQIANLMQFAAWPHQAVCY